MPDECSGVGVEYVFQFGIGHEDVGLVFVFFWAEEWSGDSASVALSCCSSLGCTGVVCG